MIARYTEHTRINSYFSRKRHDQDKYWMHETLKDLLMHGLHADPNVAAALKQYEVSVTDGTLSAFEAAEAIYRLYLSGIGKS